MSKIIGTYMNTYRPYLSVITKVLIFCFVTIMFIASVVSNVVLSNIAKHANQDKISYLKKIADVQESRLDNEFLIAQNLVRTVAKDERVIAFLEGAEVGSAESTIAHLDAYNAAQKYESVYILDAQGLTIASTNPTFQGNNYGFRNYFTQARSDEVFVTTAIGITSNNMGYYFSYPIYSIQNQNELLGVAVVKLGEENIQNVFIDQQGWETYLIDSRGVIIFGTNQSLVLKSLVEIPELQSLIGIKESQYLGKEVVSLDRESEWNQIRLSENSVFFEAPDLMNFGINSFFISKRIGEADFYLLLSATENSILGDTKQFAQSSAWQILVAAGIAMVIIGLFLYWVLLPIKDLETFMSVLADGNYQNTLEIKTMDEFEKMGDSVLKLQNKIKKDFADIARGVDESEELSKKKVRDLEELNTIMVNRELEIVKLKKELREQQKGEKV